MPLYYATLAICLLAYSDCEVENAVYAEITAPVFNSMQECHEKMIEYFNRRGFPNLKEDEDYQVIVICDNR